MSEQLPAPTSFQVRLPFLLAATLAVGMFIGQQLPRYDHNLRILSQESGAQRGTLDEILRYVEAKYVDSVDLSSMRQAALTSIFDQLDPHSVYISPEERKALDEEMQGGFEGIGIEYLMVKDTMQVVAPLADSPAERAGLLAGDRIVLVNGDTIAGVKMAEDATFRLLRGAAGTEVDRWIRRNAEPTLRQFILRRERIAVKSVQAAYMLDEHTGYIKVARFNANTYEEFMEALRPMAEEQSLQDLVIDLRGNPGGYLEECTEMLSQIFPEGKLLVYTKGRTDARREYKSTGRARFQIQHVAVLIDEHSASASEIVAGAVQDHDRGWIVGRRSFGKGLVQEQYPLSDGGALRLTIARYYTPSGRCIQRDYKHDDHYAEEAERRLHNGELSDASKTHPADTTRFYTGLGRVVYSGGGITPDVFVPLDTSFVNAYYIAMRRHIAQYAAHWMQGHERSSLPATAQDFVKNFNVTDEMLSEWADFTRREGSTLTGTPTASGRLELQLQLKARIAKLLFQNEGLYRVLNADDPTVEQALSVLRKPLK